MRGAAELVPEEDQPVRVGLVVVVGEAEGVLSGFAVDVGVDCLAVAEGWAFAAAGGGGGGGEEGEAKGEEEEEGGQEAGVDAGHDGECHWLEDEKRR